MTETLEQIKKLNRDERNYIVYSLLKENLISFTELSNLHVASLEESNKENRAIINGLAIPLISYWENGKGMKNKDHLTFIKAKAAYNLLRSKVFHTAPIEKTLKKFVKEIEYSEDKNGIHDLRILKVK